jgi:hypothetical protein
MRPRPCRVYRGLGFTSFSGRALQRPGRFALVVGLAGLSFAVCFRCPRCPSLRRLSHAPRRFPLTGLRFSPYVLNMALLSFSAAADSCAVSLSRVPGLGLQGAEVACSRANSLGVAGNFGGGLVDAVGV